MPKGARLTRKQALKQVWKTTGHKPAELAEQVALPDELAYLWQWYLELKSDKPLNFTEIHHWSSLTRKHLRSWEVDLLRSIDRIYWSVMHGN
ncbi:phage tail assembly chaperone [Pseudoalteromonas sp. T1lg65]|uniref:phage tail assembly chaperone n=1 Tax=Pseudoalteromonas sp. T1lg65 TaxID=2077101 RepID=UPI003F79678C